VIYDLFHEQPKSIGIDRNSLLELLEVNENLMDANMPYLEQRGLVKPLKVMRTLWYNARITAFGTGVIENKAKYKPNFHSKSKNTQDWLAKYVIAQDKRRS